MITKVSKNAPFQVLTSSFSISPSAEGYTLQISADGKNYSNLFSVPANTTRLVTNVAANSFYRLSGNNSEVVVNWQKSCGGGGSADLTNYYTKEETDERIQEAVSGISMDEYWTSAETKDYVDASISGVSVDLSGYYTSGQTDAAIASATANLVTSGQVKTQIESYDYATEQYVDAAVSGISLDGYWTSAETKTYVDSSISGVSVDLSGYYTSGQTDAAIASATANLVTSGDVQTQIESYDYATEQYVDNAISGISMDEYWTSAETKTYVDASISGVSGDFGALSGIVQEQQEVVSRALNDLNDRVDEISGSSVDLSSYWTSAETKTYVDSSISGVSVDLSGYYTSGQTDAAIASATANLVTSGDVQTQIESYDYATEQYVDNAISGISMDEYWTSAETKTYVDSSISGVSVDLSGYYTSGQTDAAISAATQNYPTRTEVTQEINTAVQNKVSSSTITTIWAGTQAEYDLIDTPDPNTFYVITGTTA